MKFVFRTILANVKKFRNENREIKGRQQKWHITVERSLPIHFSVQDTENAHSPSPCQFSIESIESVVMNLPLLQSQIDEK